MVHSSQTFAAFMENALYGPDGYYASGRAHSGRSGDYFTAPDAGSLFGRLLAATFSAWEKGLSAGPFDLVEAGAGEGALAKNIAVALRHDHPEMWPSLRYTAVERSEARRRTLLRLQGTMPGAYRVIPELSALPGGAITGCLFANELIDAFPVHKIRRREGKIQEAFVESTGKDRRWRWGTPSTSRIAAYFDRLEIELPDGYETEVNLAMRDWIFEAARVLSRGWIALIDYGRPASAYYAAERTNGTLRGFRRHRLREDVLSSVEMDLTADVDFTSLALNAREAGLTPLAFYEMGRFLSGGARVLAEKRATVSSDWKNFRYLAHPDGLGSAFHVLVLGKGVTLPEEFLDGNRLARLALPK